MLLRRRNSPAITHNQALAARPRRLTEAELQPRGTGAAITVPVHPTRWGRWIFRVPHGITKTFELDAIGIFVWNQCDGRNSVQQIIRKLAHEYRLNTREAEVSTIQFLHTLAKKGLIGMSMPEATE